ncbi:hypothetical protein HP532_27545 [Pseudomonas sp. CrR25]|nr:hypothetical protein [Pseudomonas sp. CrR25]
MPVQVPEPVPAPWQLPAALPAAPPAEVSLTAVSVPADPAPPAPSLSAQEAQVLMQVMLDKGDPRSPPLGALKPRATPTAAQLADPAQYQAFEDGHSRALVQAYAGGVQQIPGIRARIEAAAQSGERSATEIDEARAALEQLELLQRTLQREAPELLPTP